MNPAAWLCVLAGVCLPLQVAAQSGEVGNPGNNGEATLLAAPVPAAPHTSEPTPLPTAVPSGQPASHPPAEPVPEAITEPVNAPVNTLADVSVDVPAVEVGIESSTGRGLKPQGTQPAHWPDDLTLSPDRPDPMGLRATADALPGPTSGLASWYSDRFQGRRTASGEPYSRFEMTAAHRDLPLGSLVHVSNPETGVGVVVRVNDRGPFHGDRIIDLSRAAATVLGLVGLGVGHVDIRLPSSDEAAEFARQLAEAAKRPAKPAQTPARPGRAAGTTR